AVSRAHGPRPHRRDLRALLRGLDLRARLPPPSGGSGPRLLARRLPFRYLRRLRGRPRARLRASARGRGAGPAHVCERAARAPRASAGGWREVTMGYQSLLVDRVDGIATLTMNR